MIKILTYSSNRYEKNNYYIGADLIKQYLVDNGYNCIVDNFTVHLYPPDDGNHYVNKYMVNTDFSKDVPEIHQLEPIIQIIKNYRNDNELLDGVEKYFTDNEMENIEILSKYADE